MRSRWEFHFECAGVRFERVHKFNALITKEHAEGFGLPAKEFEAVITIEPDEKSYDPAIEQTGRIKIIVEPLADLVRLLSFEAIQSRVIIYLTDRANLQADFHFGMSEQETLVFSNFHNGGMRG